MPSKPGTSAKTSKVGAKAGKKKPGKAESGPNRFAIILMKGSAQYFEFVDQVQHKTLTSKTGLFRLAFREWCLRNGHGRPPDV